MALVPAVPDAEERDLMVAAMLALGDKNLSAAQRARLRRELRRVSKIAEELYQEGREEGREEEKLEMARRMLAEGIDVEIVARLTELSREQVEDLRRQLH